MYILMSDPQATVIAGIGFLTMLVAFGYTVWKVMNP